MWLALWIFQRFFLFFFFKKGQHIYIFTHADKGGLWRGHFLWRQATLPPQECGETHRCEESEGSCLCEETLTCEGKSAWGRGVREMDFTQINNKIKCTNQNPCVMGTLIKQRCIVFWKYRLTFTSKSSKKPPWTCSDSWVTNDMKQRNNPTNIKKIHEQVFINRLRKAFT